MKIKKMAAILAVACTAALLLTSCDLDSTTETRTTQLEKSQTNFDKRVPPKVTGEAEYKNYIKAQETVYDDPSTILWCTASFPNDASPIFTVPIAGKLTSSSVSYYPGMSVHGYSDAPYMSENQSVDGMYHGSPPAYRYGFTPAGQYVDFSNLSVFCTTALTSFQRESLKLSIADPTANSVTDQAEAKLKAGDTAGAQALLDGLKQ